ncbi:hypothetical protein A9R04_25695 [Nocardiopsis dassonvillei]|uniref:tetratricopeptide repeat protein n=1 Tax=Nocardiopsis dassonvillei TaxID=2014 RepID=UPI0008FC6361|nr:tetratricopeptide repeat protein [Nocardiopsis dassonvillei]APC37858.1 hypothetical protein A9R04_25695 [Nocardiopsis dassonvillei]
MATALLGAVVGAGLWWGGGVFTRDGWEATSWVSAVGAFLLLSAPVWVWALRRPAVEQSHWGWVSQVRKVGAEQVGVHRSRLGVGAYAARDLDAQLRPRIDEATRVGGVVLVVGDSTAGKTRTAWEAIAALAPRRWLFVPALDTDLRPLPELVAVRVARRSVVWLDDVDKHLNTSTGLDHTLIQRLTSQGALVVMTLRTHAYNAYNDTATTDLEAKEVAMVEAGRQLLRGLDPVRLERLWSEQELERASDSGDTGLVDAARRQSAETGHGVAEYLAAAPELAARWAHAQDSVGTDGGNPRGHRLVAAAVDLSRIGVEHSSTELLAAAHAHYPLPAHLHPEPFAKALAWATKPQYGTCGLLIPATADTDHARWRPFDYLLDTTDAPVPDALWGTALAHTTDPVGLFSIGRAAYWAELWVIAETAWARSAEEGHTLGMVGLGALLEKRGEQGEAEAWFRRAAEKDYAYAMVRLGRLLEKQGEEGEAETWYRKAAQQGHTDAMVFLGDLLEKRGEEGEAETWYRRAVEDGDTDAMVFLGDLLEKRGEEGEAEAWLRRAAEDGITFAMVRLGGLLEKRGEEGEAEAWFRRAAEKDYAYAMVRLGDLLTKRGEEGEAETWFRRAAEKDYTFAMAGLGILLEKRGEQDEAEAWHRRAAEDGDTYAMVHLGRLLEKRGEEGEAEAWWRRAAEDYILVMASLGDLLEKRGEEGEAEAWFRRAAEKDYAYAMVRLGRLLEKQGEEGEAEAWFRRAAEKDYTFAMAGLGRLLEKRGEQGEAEAWWRRAAEAGDTYAMVNLGDLLEERGEQGEAEAWWRRAAEAGDTYAMFALGALLVRRGGQDEAETWWRRAAKEGYTYAMTGLGILLEKRGEQDEAEAWRSRASEQKVTDRALPEVGQRDS